jgi:hypothetical protein
VHLLGRKGRGERLQEMFKFHRREVKRGEAAGE